MGLLTKKQILALGADALAHEDVDVPEWGGSVRIRELTASERAKWYKKATDNSVAAGDREVRATAYLISLTAITEDGEPLFSEKDVDALIEKSGGAIDRLSRAAIRISGLGEDSEAEGKADSAATENASS